MRSVALILLIVSVAAACSDSGGADPERFCEILDEIDAQDTRDLSPDDALPVIEAGRAKFVEGTEVAPDEIKADVTTVADGAVQFSDLLIEAGGDESAVSQAAGAALAATIFTPEYDAAAQRVNAWRTTNCS